MSQLHFKNLFLLFELPQAREICPQKLALPHGPVWIPGLWTMTCRLAIFLHV